MLNYNEYEALFNSGDDAALVAKYFDDDVVFSGGARDYRGKAQLEAFASGSRRNDTSQQMRNIARALTPDEIAAASNYYASLLSE